MHLLVLVPRVSGRDGDSSSTVPLLSEYSFTAIANASKLGKPSGQGFWPDGAGAGASSA
jgi:hypothetical protein